MGMDLTLLHKLLEHNDLQALLEKTRQQSKTTLITIHHEGEEINHILETMKNDGEHHWWEALLGWSPMATGVLNTTLHPVIIMFALVVIYIVVIVFLYIRIWVLARSVYLIVKHTEYLATDYVKLSVCAELSCN